MSTEEETFLCFKCHVTYSIEIFPMHECIGINYEQSLLRSLSRSPWINEEAQVSDQRAVLAPQRGSKVKTEASDQNVGKEVESKEDITSPYDKLPSEILYGCSICHNITFELLDSLYKHFEECYRFWSLDDI